MERTEKEDAVRGKKNKSPGKELGSAKNEKEELESVVRSLLTQLIRKLKRLKSKRMLPR